MGVLFSEPLPFPADALCTKCGAAFATVGVLIAGTFRGWCRACWEAWVEARREAAAREPEF